MKTCRSCYELLEIVRADMRPPKEENICPSCGGYKSANGSVCWQCSLPKKRENARNAARISADRKRGRNGHRLVCPKCGGRKTARADVCIVCVRSSRSASREKKIERGLIANDNT